MSRGIVVPRVVVLGVAVPRIVVLSPPSPPWFYLRALLHILKEDEDFKDRAQWFVATLGK